MNYLLALCRFPILSLVVSSLFLVSFPVRAETRLSIATTNIQPNHEIAAELDAIDLKKSKPQPLIAQSVKVTPQLEKQILEVIRRHPDVLVEVLQKYAQEQQRKEQKAQSDANRQVLKNTKELIGESPVMGAKDRKIVMVEFSDFQCPFCATSQQNVKQFMVKHKEKVTLVYKHFPLTQIHPEALPAARAAWAANKQGKFWEYHDALFAGQAKLGETFYLETANSLKLDINKFNADRKNADSAIVKDFTLGRKVGVEGTPTFFINGEVVTGAAKLEDLEKALAQVTKK